MEIGRTSGVFDELTINERKKDGDFNFTVFSLFKFYQSDSQFPIHF